MRKINYLLLLLAIFSAPAINAQSRVGTTAAPFLTMGIGAKGSALGHANTVTSNGAEGIFWNPATIAVDDGNGSNYSVLLSTSQIFLDVNSYASALVIPVGKKSRFGFGVNYVDYGRMDVRTVDQLEGNGATFGAHDMTIGLTYAQNLTESFYFGGTAKIVQQKIYDMSAQTFAFDFGFVLQTNYLNGASIGASIMNFGGKMQLEGINTSYNIDIDEQYDGNTDQVPTNLFLDEWDLPLSFKFGIVVPVINQDNLKWTLQSDVQQTNDNDINLDSGSELSYLTNTVKFHIRAGYKDLFLGDTIDSHLTYGVGMVLSTTSGTKIGFDFAQVPFEFLGNTSMIDLKLYF